MSRFIKSKKGVSLIEIIVALSIFSVVSTIALQTFTTTLQAQRKIFNSQLVQENGRYLMESVSKEIRTSDIENQEGLSNTLNIINAKGVAVSYNFINGQLLRSGEVLNSVRVEMSGQFFVKKPVDGQSAVTITMQIRSKEGLATQQSRINLQTTVSSRSY